MTSMLIKGVEYTDEEIVQAAELYPYTWILQHEIKNESGFPIEFEKRKFLKDIYNDLSPLQVWLKPPQIGATVCQTLKSFYVAKKLKRQIIYTLPTQGDVQDMVGGSVNRIISQNPLLMSWVKDHDTVEQKQVGDSMIFYRGTFTTKQAMMIPSGLNIHDEVDASDPAVITQYETRLQAQEDGGWRWYFSHPSLSGHGVDIYWQQSDKKEWFITCNQCKHEQILTWPDSVSFEREMYQCKLCKGELPVNDRINGKWRSTAVGEFSGYHVSQLMLYNKSAKDIIAAFNDPMKDKQYFWNYVLGLPYIASDSKIYPHEVLKNVIADTNTQEGVIVIGVDTGLPWHLTCVNKEGVFYYERLKNVGDTGTTPDYDPKNRIRELLKRWPKSIVVADQGGDLTPMRILQQEFPGRVFLCYYRKDKKSPEVVTWGTGYDYGTVIVDRNKMIQLIVEQMRDVGRIRLHGVKEDWQDFASHFGNIYRELIVVKESKDKDNRTLYGNEYVWKRNGPDHFVHTLLYALVGLDKYGGDMATVVGSSGFEGMETGRMFSNPTPQQLEDAMNNKATVVGGYSASDFTSNGVEL